MEMGGAETEPRFPQRWSSSHREPTDTHTSNHEAFRGSSETGLTFFR